MLPEPGGQHGQFMLAKSGVRDTPGEPFDPRGESFP